MRKKGTPLRVVSLVSSREMRLVLSCLHPWWGGDVGVALGELQCTPDVSECDGPLRLWQLAPGADPSLTDVCGGGGLPKHRDVLLLSRRI